jgi:putative ABC transport system permease protein
MTTNRLVLQHLKARPLRTVLTVSAIALSVGLVGFLLLLDGALRKDWSEMQGQRAIVVAKTSFFERLPIAYLAKIEDTPGVKRVAPFDFFMGFYRDNRPENQVPIGAAPADALIDVYVEMKLPKDQVSEWMKDQRGAVIGPILAEKFGWKVGDHIVLKAPVSGGVVEMTIRGIMKYKLDNGVYLHRKYLEGLTGEQGKVSMFWVLANRRDDVARVTAEIERKLENVPVPIRAMSEKQWQIQFMQMLGNVQALIGGIGLATAFTLFLITSNTLAMAARERRSEAALLRVLGFPRHTVLRLLLLEGGAFGVAGAVLGVGLMVAFGRVVGAAVDKTQLAGLGALLRPDAMMVIIVCGLSGALALASALVPGLNLSRKPIVQLMREAA